MNQPLTTSVELPPLQEHPVYVDGMVYIDAGQWQKAYDSFRLLQEVYPDNPEVKNLFKEIQMRTTMAGYQPRPTSRHPQRRTMRWLFLGIGLLLFIGLAGYATYEFWIRPVLLHEWRVQQVTSLRNEADEALASGDYARAQSALEELQKILPDDPQVIDALDKAKQAQHLAALYGEGTALLAAGNWAEAIQVLTELQSLDAHYRDLPQLLQLANTSLSLDKQFQAAETAFNNGDWPTAIAHYEALRQADLTFKFEDIQARLFESQLKYGQSLVEQAGTDPASVEQALAHLQEALKLRPIDGAALDERRLTESYLTALNSAKRDEKIELLRAVCDVRPNYAGQAAAQLLYSLLVEQADSLLQAGDKEAAITTYQQAIQLPIEDTAEIQQKLAELITNDSP